MTMLLSLGQHIPYKERARQIRQAACYVVGIMLVTYYAGAWIMSTFGISIPGLRIAGGRSSWCWASACCSPRRSRGRARGRADGRGGPGAARPNIAFVPLAMPGTGAGTIAMIISAASSMNSDELAHVPAWVLAVVPIVVFALLGLIFWICLTSAGRSWR